MADLSAFTTSAKYLIMDDIPFDFVPNKKQWWGGQKFFIATDKYKRKTPIEWGKPFIYLCNNDDDPTLSKHWSPWFSTNSVIVYVNNKFY